MSILPHNISAFSDVVVRVHEECLLAAFEMPACISPASSWPAPITYYLFPRSVARRRLHARDVRMGADVPHTHQASWRRTSCARCARTRRGDRMVSRSESRTATSQAPACACGRAARRLVLAARGAREDSGVLSVCAEWRGPWLQDGDRERRRRAAHWRPWHLDVRVRTFPSHPPHGAGRRVTGVAFSGEERGEYRIHTSDSSPHHGSIALRLAQCFAGVGWPRLARTHANARTRTHARTHRRACARTRTHPR
jgi:hypothetical protein